MKIENILRNIVIGGVFLLLFTPLIVTSSMFFPYIVGKAFYFRILVEAMFAAWAVLAFLNPVYRPSKSLILAAGGIFISVVALADIFGVDQFASFWSNFERMEGFVGLAHVMLYFVMLATVLSWEEIWMWFFRASLAVSVVMNAVAFHELWVDVHSGETAIRLSANLGNPEYLAVYTLVHVFLATFLAVRTRIRWEQVAYVVAGLLNAVVLYYTATRGALIGFVGGVLLAALLVLVFGNRKHASDRRAWYIAAGVVVAAVIVVGGFFAIKNTEFAANSPVLSRLASISLSEKTTRSRLMIWDMAWQGFKERPVLGWGQENFIDVFNKYYDPRLYDQEPWFDRAHSVLFDWLVAGGILGLLAYLALYVAGLYVLWRKTPLSVVEKSILTGLVGAYFVHNLFVFDHLVSYMLFFGLLAYVAQYEREKFVEAHKKHHVNYDRMQIVAPVVVVAVILAGYFLNYKAIVGNLALIQGLTPQRSQTGAINWQQNLDAFDTALAYTDDRLGELEVREQLTRTAVTITDPQTGAPSNVADQFASTTVAELTKEVDRRPNNVMAHLFLGTFYQEVGSPDTPEGMAYLANSITELQKASALSPTKQDILLQLGSAYLKENDYKDALPVFKKAYELDTDYDSAKRAYALGAIYAGDEATAKSLYDGTIPPDPYFATAYVAIKQYAKSVAIWEAIVKANPNDPQDRLYLGSNYLLIGRSDLAIAQLEEAEKLNPDLKDQVNQYLQQIRSGNLSL